MDTPDVIPGGIPDVTGLTLTELTELLDRDPEVRAAADRIVQRLLDRPPDDDCCCC